ncbi:MAG: phosphoglycerate mutase [Betaproteobacteria bacterium]|nr:phosphoglycerate mutase [Betaproteobacteria bacterium]
MHVTLLVPDLFWPRDDGGGAYRELELPGIERFLSRARRKAFPPLSLEAWLCQAFGVERQQDWPVAPITLDYDGGNAGDHYWLRADPVHLAPQRDGLTLLDASVLNPGAEDAAELVAVLNRHFAADGLSFATPHPARWYLRVPRPPRLVTREISQSAGRDITGALPSGEDCLQWRRTLNEIQMLLHDQPANQRRESHGELPINSVWLWGGGRHTTVPGRYFSHVAGGNTLALALAARTGADPVTPDFVAARRPSVAGQPSRVLVVAEAAGARFGDVQAWRAELEEIERMWFAPLLSALGRRILEHLAVVVLHPRASMRFEITALDLLRFWRTAQHLSAHAPGAT